MSTDNKYNDDQEIDLGALRQKMGNMLDRVNTRIFLMLQFFIRNIVIVSFLFVIGAGLGYYLDKTQKVYDHEIIVQPNFGSVDYLYSKIDLIESKIKKGDKKFLKTIGIANPDKFLNIEIEPVLDVYPFVNRSESNFELLKVMAEDESIRKLIEEPATAKNYQMHRITFQTKDQASPEALSTPLLKYLNNSEFYTKLKLEYAKIADDKVIANAKTIAQIDGILDGFASRSSSANGQGLVYYNNEQMNDVINTKDKLVREQGELRVMKVNYDKIVKEQSITSNIENTEVTSGKMKFVLPILLIALFVIFRLFVAFYKNQSLKYKANNP